MKFQNHPKNQTAGKEKLLLLIMTHKRLIFLLHEESTQINKKKGKHACRNNGPTRRIDYVWEEKEQVLKTM